MSSSVGNGKVTAMAVRAHVRYSEMLTAGDYWTMLKLKSTAEIAEFLKGTKAYAIPLEFLVSSGTRRALLESALNASVLDEAALIMANLEGARKQFFSDLMLRFEADHLKNVLRRIHTKNLNRDIMYTYIAHIPQSTLHFNRLERCTDYISFLEALSDSRYYEALREPVTRLAEGQTDTLFETETAIDKVAETAAFCGLGELESAERKAIEPFIGYRIDAYNIYNIHRCHCYYDMAAEEMTDMLLPVFYAVKREDLQALAETKEYNARFEILTKKMAAYSKPYEASKGQPDAELMLETLLDRTAYAKARQLFKTGTPGFHTIIGYFMMKRYEIRDVIKIVEIVRYGQDPQAAAKYLARPVLDGGAQLWQ